MQLNIKCYPLLQLLFTDINPIYTISKVDLYEADFRILKDGNWLNCKVFTLLYIKHTTWFSVNITVDGSIHGISNTMVQGGT